MGHRKFIDDEALESQLIQLTRDLVLIESTDSKPAERRRCFQLVRNHLDEFPEVQIRTYESSGYESIVATPTGVDTPEILFLGHLDVVEHLGAEYYRSTLRDGKIHGPGTGDMKGALAIMIILFRELLREQPRLSIGLAITSDEERGGENGTRFLVEEIGLKAGSVIIPDGGSIDEITVAEKGILHMELSATGRAAHAARPWRGDNALQRLVFALSNLEQAFETHVGSDLSRSEGPPCDNDHWYPTCTMTGLTVDNSSFNRIPGHATAWLDLRYTPDYTQDEIVMRVQRAVGAGVATEVLIGAQPTCLHPDAVFIGATEEIIGYMPRLVKASGGSDARFFGSQGIPVMLSRPKVGNLHGQDEWVDVQSMTQYFRICERFALTRLNGV